MNIELLEQFGQNYPEEFDGALDCVSMAVICAFNRRGSLLAVGCNDGRIIIWDFLTRGMAKIINAHVHPVYCISWSRDGHKLVSSSTDNTVCVWDVMTSHCIKRCRFSNPITKVEFNPRNDQMILVCPMKHASVIVNISTNAAGNTNPIHKVLPLDDESDLNITAAFDMRGQYIYTGNAKGRIIVIKLGHNISDQLKIVASFRVSNTAIKQIEFAPKKKDCFLVNTADRIIRVYDTTDVLRCGFNGDPEPVQKLQDLVNKTMWKKCCFSGGPDAEYICAGSVRQHALYIWERSIGTLVKILHGTKGELLLDVVWHPLRPIIASISSGVVSIWAQAQVENWSAFAPDFKELDENVEYDERESEFDVEDEDRTPTRATQDYHDENIDVDVITSHAVPQYLSSDEEEDNPNELIYLPVTLELDEAETVDTANQTSTDPGTTNKSFKKTKVVDIELKDSSREASKQPRTSSAGVSGGDKPRGKPQRVTAKRSGPNHGSETGSKRKKKVLTDIDSDYVS